MLSKVWKILQTPVRTIVSKFVITLTLTASLIAGLMILDVTPQREPDYRAMYARRANALQTEVDRIRRVLDLSVTYAFDPLIVEVVEHYAEVYMEAAQPIDPKDPTWFWVNTKEELSTLMLSIMKIESDGVIDASGDSGKAYGLTQMWLSTAQDYRPDVTGDELYDLDTHVDLAFEHLIDLLRKNHGNVTFATTAWNRGQGALARSIARGESPLNGYAAKVFTASLTRTSGD